MKILDNRVEVWRVRLDPEQTSIRDLEMLLSSDELERATRFYFEKDRARFTVTRGSLRRILGTYLDCDPVGIRFSHNEFGKPQLATPLRTELRFNLSHTDGLAIIGISSGRELGVDVERVRHDAGFLEVAESFFSPTEFSNLLALSPEAQPRAFLHCWVSKEAYLKARGTGLSIPLDSFDVSMDPDAPAALLKSIPPADVSNWRLETVSLGTDYVGAIAALNDGWSLSLRDWSL